MPHQLALEGVSAGYGRVQVLHDLSLSVPAGTVVALLGPNGAGKTTTLNVISGAIPVRKGRVLLDGGSVNRLSTYERARRGLTLIPEGRGIFPGLSVRDNLEVDRQAGSAAAAEGNDLDHVLTLFPRLGERLNQRAGTMSGGEQQMLSMARAFLQHPRVLLMDEISMGLAPRIVEHLFEAVGELKAQGMTMLLVEQFLTYALRVADICYVLAKGRIAFVGEPSELRGSSTLANYLSA